VNTTKRVRPTYFGFHVLYQVEFFSFFFSLIAFASNCNGVHPLVLIPARHFFRFLSFLSVDFPVLPPMVPSLAMFLSRPFLQFSPPLKPLSVHLNGRPFFPKRSCPSREMHAFGPRLDSSLPAGPFFKKLVFFLFFCFKVISLALAFPFKWHRFSSFFFQLFYFFAFPP